MVLREESNPLPIDSATPSFRDEREPETRLQSQFENPSDPLVVFQVADVDAPLEVKELGAKITATAGGSSDLVGRDGISPPTAIDLVFLQTKFLYLATQQFEALKNLLVSFLF